MSVLLVLVMITASFAFRGDNTQIQQPAAAMNTPGTSAPISLFTALKLQYSGIPEDAFNYAVKGLDQLKKAGEILNDSILSIIDFTKPSANKRLFVINLHTGEVLFNTYVSHGRNSGLSKADAFSNAQGSYKSSLGFYVTSGTYEGKHGLSLKLKGEESGINDNAEDRGIVMHAADYVNESLIRERGYIGRSEGCPAVSPKLHKAIISTIKGGTCLFIYNPQADYLAKSQILN